MNIARRFAPLLSAAVVLAGCDGNPSGSGAATPAQLVIVSGDAQQATVGTELAQPLVVRVVDSKGKPVRDQIVNFRVVSGGGSVYAGSAITNQDGEARERWTLGTVVADSQRVEARAVDSSTGAAQLFGTFRATAAAGPAAAVQVVTGTYAGAIGAPVADSVTARVVDAYGNPVAGAQVAWQVTAGGGSVSPATSASNAAGIAKTQWTLGTVMGSTQQMVVKLNGSVGGSFVAQPSLSPGAGAVVTLLGDGQTATVATAPAQPVGVKVTLPDGRPVIGLYVHYHNVSTDVYTDSLGVALLPVEMPYKSGPFAPVATVGSLGQVTFHFTAAAGAPRKFLTPPLGGVNVYQRGIPVGTQVSLMAQLADEFDNPVPGVTVTWQVGGTASVSAAQSVTNANGEATTVFTAGPYVNGNTANGVVVKVGSITGVYFIGQTLHRVTATITPTSPDTIVVSVGDSLQVGVTVQDETGAPYSLPSGRWAWNISNRSVIQSSDFSGRASFQMKAIAPGTVNITAGYVPTDFEPNASPSPQPKVVIVQ